ncbi:unnamed protein product, partial [Closterium sp. NIES-53]
NSLLVRTPADRIKAMRARPIRLVDTLSQVELYFLLPFVYCVTNPLYLPFALAFYILAFVIYRNQIINVYCPRYEMAGAFWPHFHARLVAAMLVQQVTLGGILSLKDAPSQACCLIPLPFVTIIVHWAFIRGQFHSTFSKLALESCRYSSRSSCTGRSSAASSPAPFQARPRGASPPSSLVRCACLLHDSRGGRALVRRLNAAVQCTGLFFSPRPVLQYLLQARSRDEPSCVSVQEAQHIRRSNPLPLFILAAARTNCNTRPSFPPSTPFPASLPAYPASLPACLPAYLHTSLQSPTTQEANRKDTIDRTVHPNEDPHSFLARAYLHPSLQSAFTMLDGDEEQGGTGGDDSSSSDDDDEDGDEEEGGGKKSKLADRHAQTRLVPVKRHPFSSSAQASPAVRMGSDGLEAVAGTSPPAHLRPRSVSDGPGSSASAAAAAVSAVTSAAAAAASAAFAAARSAASSGAAALSAASSGRVAADADVSTHTPHGIPPASRDRSSEASPYHSCELASVVVDGPEDVSQNVPLSASAAHPVDDAVVQRGAAAASEGMTGGSRGEKRPSPQTAGTEPLLAGGGGKRGGDSSGMGKAVGVPVFRL